MYIEATKNSFLIADKHVIAIHKVDDGFVISLGKDHETPISIHRLHVLRDWLNDCIERETGKDNLT